MCYDGRRVIQTRSKWNRLACAVNYKYCSLTIFAEFASYRNEDSAIVANGCALQIFQTCDQRLRRRRIGRGHSSQHCGDHYD